jgi:uncharacterized membrane protein YhaH (DUF805 family)
VPQAIILLVSAKPLVGNVSLLTVRCKINDLGTATQHRYMILRCVIRPLWLCSLSGLQLPVAVRRLHDSNIRWLVMPCAAFEHRHALQIATCCQSHAYQRGCDFRRELRKVETFAMSDNGLHG